MSIRYPDITDAVRTGNSQNESYLLLVHPRAGRTPEEVEAEVRAAAVGGAVVGVRAADGAGGALLLALHFQQKRRLKKLVVRLLSALADSVRVFSAPRGHSCQALQAAVECPAGSLELATAELVVPDASLRAEADAALARDAAPTRDVAPTRHAKGALVRWEEPLRMPRELRDDEEVEAYRTIASKFASPADVAAYRAGSVEMACAAVLATRAEREHTQALAHAKALERTGLRDVQAHVEALHQVSTSLASLPPDDEDEVLPDAELAAPLRRGADPLLRAAAAAHAELRAAMQALAEAEDDERLADETADRLWVRQAKQDALGPPDHESCDAARRAVEAVGEARVRRRAALDRRREAARELQPHWRALLDARCATALDAWVASLHPDVCRHLRLMRRT